ncbi:MAG: EscS/YscS/HrcS family type III secretion system export apparatus protein [Rhizobacter sp.]
MMPPESIIELTSRALKLVMILVLPTVLTAALLGLLIGIIQAVTQIQDQSIAQSVKLLVIMALLAATAGWMGREVFAFSLDAFSQLSFFSR